MPENSYTYEIVKNEENLPYSIYIHSKKRIRAEGFIDENGKLIVSQLLKHWHNELEINFLFSGTVVYYVNEKKYTLHSGELIVIGCEDIHSIDPDYDSLPDEGPLGFTLLINNDFLRHLLPDLDQCVFDTDKVTDLPAACELMREIFRCEYEGSAEYKSILITSLVCRLIYEICAAGAKTEKSAIPAARRKDMDRLRAILKYVESSYAEDLTLEGTAAHFYLSRGYFARFFKQHTGMTFKEYLTRFRLQKAVELLGSAQKPTVTDTAMQVGFSDTRRFILACKKYYGMTPAEYRAERSGGS